MLCKIVKPEDLAEPIVWRRIGPEPPDEDAGISTPRGASNGAAQPAKQKPGARPGELLSNSESLQKRIAELEAQLQSEKQQAHREGLDQGLRKAREEASAEMQGALDKLAQTIQEVAQVKPKIRNEAEKELVKLALAIARRILHREVSADPESIRGIVYAALQRLQNREVSRIRVYPAAVQAVKSALERNGGLSHMEIVPDASLQPGGVLFETALGELDASVDSQLQEIDRGFADRLNG